MILSLLFSSLLSIADAVPLQLTQQGRVLDNNGAAISGLHDITFRIYDAQTGGSVLWSEPITIDFTNGYYAAVLGADEQNNPLDSSTLSLYPLYLEIQIDSNAPMNTRQAINSTPYAQIAGLAESVDGGVVNASEIQINTTQVIDGSGNWVGQPITISWNDIDPNTIPADLADGDDNTHLDEPTVEGYITNGAIDLAANSEMNGDVLLTETSSLDWNNLGNTVPSDLADGDDDTLAALSCQVGEIAGWDGSWTCVSDNTLDVSDIQNMLSNNAVDLNPSTTIGGLDIITSLDDSDTLAALSCGNDGDIARYDLALEQWYCDADNDTQLDEPTVENYVTNDSINLAANSQVDGSDILTQPSNCSDGQILVYSLATASWACGQDTDSTLSASEVQAMVESISGLALQAGATVDGSLILTEASSIDPTQLDGSGGTAGQVLITDGSTLDWGETTNGSCSFTSLTPGYSLVECGSSSLISEGTSTQWINSSQGAYHTCAISTNGSMQCWGNDGHSQTSNTPTNGTFSEVSSGYTFNCALETNGSIQCWGNDTYGQVSNIPSGNFTKVEAGGSHACAIDTNSSIQCWGSDDHGQVSNNPTNGTFSSIAGGANFTCALDTSGSIQCWGNDTYGQVSNTPTNGTFVDIEAGALHICALNTSGSIQCWGEDSDGQVSNAPTNGVFSDISSNCAIETTGAVQCWGRDNYGQVSNTPSHTGFSSIYTSLGELHNCGILTSNLMVCWGANLYGELDVP